ncbi:hypothetical protein BTI679_27130 [Bacillus wiedmannii]|nr:hypothetical protein BTI679_27130 [Bacillus wiedmannii]
MLEWGDVINEYQPVMTAKGLQLIQKEGFK